MLTFMVVPVPSKVGRSLDAAYFFEAFDEHRRTSTLRLFSLFIFVINVVLRSATLAALRGQARHGVLPGWLTRSGNKKDAGRIYANVVDGANVRGSVGNLCDHTKSCV